MGGKRRGFIRTAKSMTGSCATIRRARMATARSQLALMTRPAPLIWGRDTKRVARPSIGLAFARRGSTATACGFTLMTSRTPRSDIMKLIPGLAALLCVIATASSAEGPELRAGAAAVKITPPKGAPLAGYYYNRAAEGVHDDLYAKALVLEQGGTQVAFVVCDLISLSRPIVEQARRLITDSSRVHGKNVMMSATHSHTGPVLHGGSTRNAAQGGEEDVAVKYAEELPWLIAESVKLAAKRLTNAVVSAAIGYEEHLSFNRRFFMRDGTVAWNPGKANTNIVRAAGPIDPDVGVLLVQTPDAKAAIATYVNFAMHPDTVGGLQISADYPYTLARLLSEYK